MLRLSKLTRKECAIADKITVKDLLEDEIKDLYSAEKQLTKAIPKMAKGSNDTTLRQDSATI